AWGAYQERLPTADEVAAWPWQQATGLAVVVGPALWQHHAYLWVLEAEGRHRGHAEGWLDLELPHWRSAGVVAESGGGSLHVYCEASAPVETCFCPWGELRGEGAVCVLPPSRHPNGRLYRWLAETEPILLDPSEVPGAEERTRLRFGPDSGPI